MQPPVTSTRQAVFAQHQDTTDPGPLRTPNLPAFSLFRSVYGCCRRISKREMAEMVSNRQIEVEA